MTVTTEAPALESDAPTTPPTGLDAPAWLAAIALTTAAGMLSFGLLGLVLAINGWYRPAVVFPLAAIACVGLVFVAWPAVVPRRPVTRSSHVYATIGLVAIATITVWNMAHASEHVQINRDGGAYTNTGRWIARDGSLVVNAPVGPFKSDPRLAYFSYATYYMPDKTTQFQFAHLLPVVLAGAYNIAGDRGLFHMPELLGGIALLSFFMLSWRLFRRPLFALSAMLALAFIIPQISFSRDSYSEIPSQVLLFTAMWLLVTRRVLPSWRVAFVAGLMLGATEATRIDAFILIAGVPPIIAMAWLLAAREDRKRVVLAITAFVAGIVPAFTVGLIDVMRHSGFYYRDLAHNVHLLMALLVASVVASALVVAVGEVIKRWPPKLPWRPIATALGVVVMAAGFGVWLLRPHVQTARAGLVGLTSGLQAFEHVKVDGTRTYYEQSMNWMVWYLGPLTVAVAIVGAGLLVRELILGRLLRTLSAVALLVPVTALYLWRADAAPDHVWVTRRFLVGAFPILILLSFGLAAFVFEWQRFARVAKIGAIVFVVIAIGYPLYLLRPIRAMSEQRSFVLVVEDVCKQMGDHSALIVLEHDHRDLTDDWMPQAFRGWCGADVAVMRSPNNAQQQQEQTDDLRKLAQQWQAAGKSLYVTAISADAIQRALPDATVVPTIKATNPFFLARSLTKRPSKYESQNFQLVTAKVPVPTG